MFRKLVLLLLLTIGLGDFARSTVALAHGGGTPQLVNGEAGPYRIYAWTQPEPVRVGEFHLTVAVTDATVADEADGDQLNGQDLASAVVDANVTIRLEPVDGLQEPIQLEAELQEQLAGFYYETDAKLPTDGEWKVQLLVDGPDGLGASEFNMMALEARSVDWRWLATGIVLFLAVIAFVAFLSRLSSENRSPQRASERVIERGV